MKGLAKKKKVPLVVLEDPPISVDDLPVAKIEQTALEEYAFPTKARCPRCGSTQTKRATAVENLQYRRCMRPTCRHSFKVIGKAI